MRIEDEEGRLNAKCVTHVLGLYVAYLPDRSYKIELVQLIILKSFGVAKFYKKITQSVSD